MNERRMAQQRKRRLSLAVRVTLLLMFAAIAPLVITVVSSELLSRPALTSQARTSMDTDARERVQLINTYLNERVLDAETLSQVPTVQQFLATPPKLITKDLTTHALYALAAGIFRDKRYTTWTLFDPQGHLRLYYPLNIQPQPHGQYIVPPEDLQTVQSGKAFISGVYFDSVTQKASVDIYAPIAANQQFLGFMRSSLNLDYIWDIVNSELGANGTGSYAFMLDQNGVRIADTEPTRRFKAVAPLSPQVQLAIKNESLYGAHDDVPLLADSALASAQQDTHTSSFEVTPTGQSEPFQVTRHATLIVPWTYFVLSPTSTVTAVVNQQLFITGAVGFIALLLAAIVGFYIGHRITRPILLSVDSLRKSTEVLNTLATKQQGAASEQRWVVDSSQVGLQSVQYYTGATNMAAHQLRELGGELIQRWYHLDPQTANHALGEMISTAQYIEDATTYQDASSQKLATAIKVTTQVTDQLATGATSAADAATQLEEVVNQLRRVVGR